MMAMMLDEFTRTVDVASLPRVLHIQSGVYVEGSVYEMFGRECCLPTGEIMKIIGINTCMLTAEIEAVDCEAQIVSLPLYFPGLFRIVADERPYLTIGEITGSVRIGPEPLGQPVFRCSHDLPQANAPLRGGECFTLVSLESDGSEGYVECRVTGRDAKQHFTLKLSQQGEFYECEDDQFYTLKELAEWKMAKGRKRRVKLAQALLKKDLCFYDLPENYSGELILSPVYELQAVMKYRKDVVRIPSTLDVEVIDITDQFDGDCFPQLLSLSDIFKKPSEEFPILAEVIEPPLHTKEEFQFLIYCKQIIIHAACSAKRILASEIRSDSQRRFLIPLSYKGRLKRRPREFPTGYDLEVAKRDKEQLHVVATRAFESHYEGLSTVFVGDQYLVQGKETSEVIYGGTRKTVEALACEKIEGKNYQSVLIPLYLDGAFVEVIHDKKQYSISEVCQRFHLPFNVKVSVRDLSVPEDTLAAVPGLCLEEEITDPYLLVSSPDLSQCWEVPVNRTFMTVQVLPRKQGAGPQPYAHAAVEEIGEDCYYTLRRYASATLCPPPRPPKKPKQPPPESVRLPLPKEQRSNPTGSPKCPNRALKPVIPEESDQAHERLSPKSEKLTSAQGAVPHVDHQRAMHENSNCGNTSVEDDDEDKHDYEYIDENTIESIRTKFQNQNINNTVSTKANNRYEQSV
uniref:Thymocyte selection associated n=1 Tax=Paramormyrops kingsleyae TaxID=1676925 RepID=A0A3B3SJS1_9TELE|nr:protein THEMIS [Paramormyrops kingsleyae]